MRCSGQKVPEVRGFCLASDRSLLNSRRVRKWVKTLIAVLLLPLSIGATRALVRVLRDSGGADAVWVAMLAGAACWLVYRIGAPAIPQPTDQRPGRAD